MTALPAPNRLAALQRDILVAVAALVVDCAGVEVDLLLRLGGVGVVATVLLCGHFDFGYGIVDVMFVRSSNLCGMQAAAWSCGCEFEMSRNVRGGRKKARRREHVPYRLRTGMRQARFHMALMSG